MIVFSQLLPTNSPQGKDARGFLKKILPRGAPEHLGAYRVACKHLQLTSEAAHETLALIVFAACNKNKPLGAERIQETAST